MQEPKKNIDSTIIYSKRMLSNMDMADRTTGELKKTFTKEYEKNASDLDRYTKVQSMKKKLLTPKRTMEVADSLSKEGRLKLATAVKFRKEKEKSGTYANKYMSDKFLDSAANDANKDIDNAVRYRGLALKSMNKNK